MKCKIPGTRQKNSRDLESKFLGMSLWYSQELETNSQERDTAFPGMRYEFPGIRCGNSGIHESVGVEVLPGIRIQSTRNELVEFPGMKCKIPGTSQKNSRD